MRTKRRKPLLSSVAACLQYLDQAGFRMQVLVLGMGTALALAVLMAVDLPMNSVSLKVGELATRTVTAPRDCYYIDRVATEERCREAEARVVPSYEVDPEVKRSADATIINTFQRLRTLSETLAQSDIRNLDRIRASFRIHISEELIMRAIGAKPDDLLRAQQAALTVVGKVFTRGIRSNTNDLQIAHETIRRSIENSDLPATVRELATQVALRAVYRPNWNYDERKTEQSRRAERERVEPVRSRIEAGEVIVQAGQPVTDQVMDKLIALGLQSPRLDIKRAASFFLLAVFFIVVLGLFMNQSVINLRQDYRLVTLLSLIVVLALFAYRIVTRFPGLAYVAIPITATAGMVTAIMLDTLPAVMVAVMVGVMTSTMANNDLSLCVMAIVSSLIGIHCVSDNPSRAQLMRTGFILGGVNIVLSAALGTMTGHGTPDIIAEMSRGLGSGVLCAILTLGLVMFLERPFRVTTHFHLLELSDPNEPILKRLQLEAPGTCTHSIMVGNLAEGAAKAIGADALLARVASYYHDIGKLKRPYLFSENQFTAENVHDRLSPSLSTLAIIAHVKEGVEMARNLRLPQAIIDIIPQHHGTSLVSFFYNRAVESCGAEAVAESAFRYPGPKPQTREAATVMLADGIEAAARSLSQPTHARVEAMVRKIITERLEDGQLMESNLTLRDLEVLARTFTHMLKGLVHTRVEYPEQARDIPALYLDPGKGRPKGELTDVHNGGNARTEKGVAGETTDSSRHLRRLAG